MKIKTQRPTDLAVPQGWIKGSTIPDLIKPELWDMYFDPEEVQMMREEQDGERKLTTNTDPKKGVHLKLHTSLILKLKAIAKQEGMPYQTLMTSVLHKFAHKQTIPHLD